MAKAIFNYKTFLRWQREELETAEKNAKFLDSPAGQLIEYEPEDYAPYATRQEIEELLGDIESRENRRALQSVKNALSCMKVVVELIQVQSAYHQEQGKIISADHALALENDEQALLDFFANTFQFINDRKEIAASTQKDRFIQKIHDYNTDYVMAISGRNPNRFSGLPIDVLTQRIHDLRAASGHIAMRDNETKISILHTSVDTACVIRKHIDDGAIKATAKKRDLIEQFTANAHGYQYLINESITNIGAFFDTLSKSSAYDPKKGKFIAHEVAPLSVKAAVQNIIS